MTDPTKKLLLRLLNQHPSRVSELAERANMSMERTRTCLREMQKQGWPVRVESYTPTRGGWIPVWAVGMLPDAVKPAPLTPEERYARNLVAQAKYRRKVGKVSRESFRKRLQPKVNVWTGLL